MNFVQAFTETAFNYAKTARESDTEKFKKYYNLEAAKYAIIAKQLCVNGDLDCDCTELDEMIRAAVPEL